MSGFGGRDGITLTSALGLLLAEPRRPRGRALRRAPRRAQRHRRHARPATHARVGLVLGLIAIGAGVLVGVLTVLNSST
ncbi:MAG TPA: hypothetical protein VF529_15355 [Solirubrobacteraceae bacterium]|jgi:hypothetical protein